MNDKSRAGVSRRALLGGAAAAAAVAGTAALPPALRRATAAPAPTGTGTVADVGHVVIFMQENRAFDHYFGSLSGVRGFGDRNAVRLPTGRPVWHQPASSAAGTILPFRMDTTTTSATCADAPP